MSFFTISRMETKNTANNSVSPLKSPPNPGGLPIIGQLFRLATEPLAFLDEMVEKYDGMIYLGRIHGKRHYLCFEPEYAKQILADNRRFYPRLDNVKALEPLTGNGLLVSSGDYWLRQRRLMQPAFHRRLLDLMLTTMTDTISETIRQFHTIAAKGEPVDIASEFSKLTARIISNIMFSTDISDDADRIDKCLKITLAYLFERRLSPFNPPDWWPTQKHRTYRKSLATLHEITDRLIHERYQSQIDTGDLLSMLIHAQDPETGEKMTPQQLHDEVNSILLAGHDTTANALTWAWLLLDQHSDIDLAVQAEADTVLQAPYIDLTTTKDLQLAEKVFNEALRLYPPAWITVRSGVEANEIAGYQIPANSIILISAYAIHHHPLYWQNPKTFDPERFSPENENDRHRFAFLPFGAGQHLCIGKHIALLEGKLIIAMLKKEFQFDVLAVPPVVPKPAISLGPKNGMMVKIKRRS